jgi:diguanylate cyclase (GGDEF)-like protein/PAS domain S-box-containing protein
MKRKSLASQKGFYEILMFNSPIAIVLLDSDGAVITYNRAFEQLFGYTQKEASGQHIDSLVADEEIFKEASSYTRRVLERGETILATGRRRKKDGTPFVTEIHAVPVAVEGSRQGALVHYSDITSRRKAEKNLQDYHRSLTMILDGLDADIYAADLVTHEILFMNQHMRESFGGDFSGQTCYKVFRNEKEQCPHCSNEKLVDDDGKPAGVFVWEGKNPITERWYKNSDRVIPWEGDRLVRLQIATDITDLKKVEELLEHKATHDPLTGLPNRMLLHDRLLHAIDKAKRTKKRLAVLFLDLDKFKSVNDEYGHQCGDELLKLVADRLREAVRECDTISRVSGDEFVIILEELTDSNTSCVVANRILKAISLPHKLSECEISTTISIGIASFPADADTPDELLRLSDEAMYRAKTRGRNGYSLVLKRDS